MPGGTYWVGWDLAERIHFIVKEGSDERIIYSNCTLPTAEILSGKNARAFLVCGFLIKSFKKIS